MGFNVEPESLLVELQAQISLELLRLIGAAIHDGWLITAEDGRGYFVRETAADSPAQPTVYHAGNGKVIPWWELYIQLADYARLREIAGRRGLVVRMEDRQMDITVWAGDRMLLYVENKVTATKAKTLLSKMRRYGELGFELTDDNKGNDPLRKAMYLFQDDCQPPYFAISAIGYQQLFKVEYGENSHRFSLIEQPGDITTPLIYAEATGVPPMRSSADALAVELQRAAYEREPESGERLWLSPGTGQTAFNAYVHSPIVGNDTIVVAAYKDGRVWSALKEIPPELVNRLSGALSEIGISVDTAAQYPFWRKGGSVMMLTESDAPSIAEAVVSAI
jgi:hypothetical protein